jgi:ADP-heptose:LPS heptosyltransferase
MTGAKYLHGFDFLSSGKSGLPKFANGESEWEASTIARRVLPVVKVDLNSEDSWDLVLTDQEISEAEKLLSPIIEKESPIVFSTGTKLQTNHWGMNNWINLLSELSMKLSNQPAIFLGSHDEISESEACNNAWNGLFLNLCGKTTPRVAAAILKRSKLFIGHDSGPMHLASCVGTPCVAIFSARNLPAQWFPRGKNNTIIYHKTECAGCGLEVCITQKKKCIMSISVEEAYNAVIDKLMQLD